MSKEQHVRELALITARAKLIELIAARAPERFDRYADLRSQARTRAAWDLISQVYWGIAEHEQTSGRRVRQRRARTGAKLDDAIQRFVGDLLRARSGTNATGRIYRPTGHSQFGDVPVTYTMFKAACDGLKALGLVGHSEGHSRYRQTGFTTLEIVGNRNGRPVYQETGPVDQRYKLPFIETRIAPTTRSQSARLRTSAACKTSHRSEILRRTKKQETGRASHVALSQIVMVARPSVPLQTEVDDSKNGVQQDRKQLRDNAMPTIMPCFDRCPREGDLLGRLLAGYGELELEMCACVAATTDDLNGAIKMLFSIRGEYNRIKTANSMMKAAYASAGLASKYNRTMANMDWCRTVRNQYAHCNWYHTTSEGLCFVDLERTAKLKTKITSVVAHRYPIDAVLLKRQETYFAYVRECYWHLAEAYGIARGKGFRGGPLHSWPPLLARPTKHN